jgi:hypothetical protein
VVQDPFVVDAAEVLDPSQKAITRGWGLAPGSNMSALAGSGTGGVGIEARTGRPSCQCRSWGHRVA